MYKNGLKLYDIVYKILLEPRKGQKEKEPETSEEEGSRRRTTRTRKQTDTLPVQSAGKSFNIYTQFFLVSRCISHIAGKPEGT